MPLPTPAQKTVSKHPAKTANPHPRHEHAEWHTPREGQYKAPHSGVPIQNGRPHGRGR